MVVWKKRRVNVTGGIACVGEVPLGIRGVSSFVVFHVWSSSSYVWSPCVVSVVGVNKVCCMVLYCVVRMGVSGAPSLVVLHSWVRCSFFMCCMLCPFGVGVDKRRVNADGGVVLVCVVHVGVHGTSSLVVFHVWLPRSSGWFPCARSVVGANKRWVKAVGDMPCVCDVRFGVPRFS